MLSEQSVSITEDEAALYDRQIRLWGLDAQKRLRAANVLLVGVGGIGAEVAKNIVLSGIKSLTLLDHREVTNLDFCCQFLIDRVDFGKNRAESSLDRTQQLNPMVEVTADGTDVADKDEDFFKQYHVVCVSCCAQDQLIRINDICHRNNVMFFCGDVFGFYAYMFSDLNEYEYADEVATTAKKQDGRPASDATNGEPAAKMAKQEPETKTVKKTASFVRLKDALAVDWGTEEAIRKLKRTPKTYFIFRVLLAFRNKHGRDPQPASQEIDCSTLLGLRDSVMDDLKVDRQMVPDDFVSYCFAELSPVCAVAGGILGQEIIKAVSKKDAPHNNFFFFNGLASTGMVDRIG